MDENVIAVSHVETELDADCAIAALSDNGINAAKQHKNTAGGAPLFAMPTAMGFGASEGYDILVSKNAEKEAREILIGAGFAEPTEEEMTSEDTTEDDTTDEAISALPEEAARKGSVLMVILFLVAASLFIIGVDRVIEIIKSLF